MKKTLVILTLIFLTSLIFVSAEKVDIGDSIKEYILDNYKEIKLTETSIIFYYNPDTCPDCEESRGIIEGLVGEGYSILITTDYFTKLSAGSLAICMNDYSTRINIKSEEIKGYADYCKNFKVPSGGIFSVVPKKEKKEGEISVMSLMGLEYKAVDEDIAYVLPWPGGDFIVSLDNNNPKVRAMSQQEQNQLMDKAKSFVFNRVWGSVREYDNSLLEKEDELNEEKKRIRENELTPESMERLEEISEERQKIQKELEEFRALQQKASKEGIDLLKDYFEPYEGEVIDGFTIRKGDRSQTDVDFINVPKKPPENLPLEYYTLLDKKKAKEGGWEDTILIFAQIDSAYVFAEDEKPETQPEEITIEEEKPAVEEKPVTGIRRITEPIKKLFTGESETEEIPPVEKMPEEPKEKEGGFIRRFFKKIFSWF